MTDQHRATPETWTWQERVCADGGETASCLLELRDRVEALEAAAISAPENPDTLSDRPAPADSLVERVQHAIIHTPFPRGSNAEARAAIREVAAWLTENYTPDTCGIPAGQLLRDEASR